MGPAGTRRHGGGQVLGYQHAISDGTNPGSLATFQQLGALLRCFAGQNGYDVSAKADLGGYPDAASVAT